MGLLDAAAPQQAPQMGGLLGQGAPAPQAPQGAAPQGGMPPEMMAVVEKLKQADPDSQQKMLQQIIQHMQSSGKPPQEIQAGIQQLMAAVRG